MMPMVYCLHTITNGMSSNTLILQFSTSHLLDDMLDNRMFVMGCLLLKEIFLICRSKYADGLTVYGFE